MRGRVERPPYERFGTHALEIARAQEPGPGLPPKRTRWCCKCCLDKPVRGSTVIGGVQLCADCKPRGVMQ